MRALPGASYSAAASCAQQQVVVRLWQYHVADGVMSNPLTINCNDFSPVLHFSCTTARSEATAQMGFKPTSWTS